MGPPGLLCLSLLPAPVPFPAPQLSVLTRDGRRSFRGDESRPQGQQCLVWAHPASEEGLGRRWVTLPCADTQQAWRGKSPQATLCPDPRRLLVQPGAGRTFQTCHCWGTLTRKLCLPGLWQTSPSHTTTQSSPSREEAPYSALHRHSQTQPDVCLAVLATEALVGRAGNRPVGRWMADSRWCDPSGTRAQRICTGPRASSR